MKTDIFIPQPIFESAKQLAQQLDMSLSEFYTVALVAYMTKHTGEAVTSQLNEVYETTDSTIEPDLMALQIAAIGEERW